MQRRVVIAGTASGAGKTTLTIGIMAALKQMGLEVQGFKCGPDVIDPLFHTAVCGRASRNLDSWLLTDEIIKQIYIHGSNGADISIIEGVMGLYDGHNPLMNRGSTAEISMWLNSPVILVVDCYSMARSAAAVVKGFQLFEPELQLAGVIANRVGGEGHYRLIQQAVEQECGIPVIGYLSIDEEIAIPERQWGLLYKQDEEQQVQLFNRLGELVRQTIHLEQLLKLAEAPAITAVGNLFTPPNAKREHVKIAVAKDEAFCAYYPENLELLQLYGAECVFFSPLAGERLPDAVQGLYLGGGLTEVTAKQLAAQEAVKHSLAKAITRGLPTLAEAGGFSYLCEEIVTTTGERLPMAGVIPGTVQLQNRLAAIGYREVIGHDGNYLLPAHESARGHEFHYAHFSPRTEYRAAFHVSPQSKTAAGYLADHLVASFTQLHFASCPQLIKRWLDKCQEVASDV